VQVFAILHRATEMCAHCRQGAIVALRFFNNSKAKSPFLL
jgi:hypothetical protein